MEWGQKRAEESINMKKARLGAVRRFGKYLNFIGKQAYVVPSEYIGKQEPFYPYIFTDDEIQIFFETIDKIIPSKRTPFTEYTVPVFFRIAYGCGLRSNELRDLRRYDVNLNEGTLLIRNSKNNRDRIIPISADLQELCNKYDYLAEKAFPNRKWFFQMHVKDSYRRRWIANQLKRYWEYSGLEEMSGKSPRVYDFRHNFATRVMANWFDNAEDVMALLPYLSNYMGHVEFQSTTYYIHLLPDRIRNNHCFDWNKFCNLIPEVFDDEE